MTKATLLVEIGTEELPAAEVVPMAESLARGLADGLMSSGLSHSNYRVFATPRRLAVQIYDLLLKAENIEKLVLGPSLKIAKNKTGDWSAAALGFAKKQGMAPDKLEITETTAGSRISLKIVEEGPSAERVIPIVLRQTVQNLHSSKRMRWGRARHEFIRPVQWLVVLLNSKKLSMELMDLESGRVTHGHRFHCKKPIELKHAEDYEDQLLKAWVIACPTERKQVIKRQINEVVKDDEKPVITSSLLDEICGLVEWPVALRGEFDPKFLELPQQALISSMREHQKYFHINLKSGSLAPAFVTISNIQSTNPESVIAGNERVIRPRLSDAAFFFSRDKQTSLSKKTERLKSVIFHEKLGSLADKQNRVHNLATSLSPRFRANTSIVNRSSLLFKCDLVSELVIEFPDLQGIAGSYYAAHDGEPPEVCLSIEEHYWPKFAGDVLPTTTESAVLALSDRLDTLVSIIGIGQMPTGSKDPFGLRRAAVAVVRILLKYGENLLLQSGIDLAIEQFEPRLLKSNTAELVIEYITERLPALYDEKQVGVDILRSVTSLGIKSLPDLDSRVFAVRNFVGSGAAESLAAANKRVANMLSRETENLSAPDTALFVLEAETNLYEAICSKKSEIHALLESKRYQEALTSLAELKGPTDKFFNEVMVNVDNHEVRLNRLSLLHLLRKQFLKIADFAVLAR